MSKEFTIPGPPVPKPRQTRSDKWRQRLCVLRYRRWADEARKSAGQLPLEAFGLRLIFYLPMPKSWAKNLKDAKLRDIHRTRPDIDNLLKAAMDALWPDGDSQICRVTAEKFWDDGAGARTEVIVE